MYLTINTSFLTFLPVVINLNSLKSAKNEIEIKGFNNIYYFEFGKNFTHAPEKHDFWEMVYVDSGKIVAITDGIGCTLNQGQLIFHEPNETHAHSSDEKTPNNLLVVSFTSDSEAMNFFTKKTFYANKTVRTLLSLFMSESKNALGKIPSNYNDTKDLDFSNASFGSYQLLSCYFTELLISLIRENSDNSKLISTFETRSIAQNTLYELILEYLKENIYRPLTIKDICSHFIMGKTQLFEIFNQNNTSSVMEYYNQLKLNEAKKLLREEKNSVTQIADMLGYSCVHSFSRAFKAKFGFSPREYKNSII